MLQLGLFLHPTALSNMFIGNIRNNLLISDILTLSRPYQLLLSSACVICYGDVSSSVNRRVGLNEPEDWYN